jgi:Flp pilus assembly protein TadD
MPRSRPSALAACALALALAIPPACAAAPPADTAPVRPGIGALKDMSLAGAFLAARHAEASDDDVAATVFFTRALQLDPDNADLLRSEYFVAAQVGDFAVAVPAAKKSFEAAPQLALAPLIAAIGAYHDKDYPQAWSYLDKISVQSPVGFALPMLRAWGIAPLGKPEQALTELAPLQGANGAVDLYNVMAGMLNEYFGHDAQALTNYDALAGKIDQEPLSIVRLVCAGYLRLGKAEAVKGLTAKYQAAHGNTPMADDYLQAFADPRRQPKKVTPADGMAEALFTAAQMMLQSAPNTSLSAQLSVVYGQAALYLNPDLDIARRIIGATLAARDRFEESNAMLATIKKDEPGYYAVQMQIAENLESMDKDAESLAVLQTIAKERPDWPDAQIALGDYMRREKKFAEAVDAYDRAFKLYPKGTPVAWQLYYARGIALERTRQFDRADKDFRKALELNPEEPSVLNYLGYSLLDRGVSLPEARELIEKAFKLQPDNGYIIDSLGWVLYVTGDTDGAVLQLEKAVEADPSDPTINEHLGDAYWKAGRRTEAMFQWRRALTLGPEDEQQRAQLQSKLAQGLARN